MTFIFPAVLLGVRLHRLFRMTARMNGPLPVAVQAWCGRFILPSLSVCTADGLHAHNARRRSSQHS